MSTPGRWCWNLYCQLASATLMHSSGPPISDTLALRDQPFSCADMVKHYASGCVVTSLPMIVDEARKLYDENQGDGAHQASGAIVRCQVSELRDNQFYLEDE